MRLDCGVLQCLAVARPLLNLAAMSFIDVLIIYLACGAPSSVFELTRTDHRSAFAKLRFAVIALLFWPVHLCILAGFALSSVRQRTKQEKIHAVRQKIEEALFVGATPRRVFEFRDTFYRTGSLSDALCDERTAVGQREVFAAVGHPDPDLAARCAARRDRRKMRTHLNSTVDEFLELFETERAKRVIAGDELALDGLLAEFESVVPGLGLRISASKASDTIPPPRPTPRPAVRNT